MVAILDPYSSHIGPIIQYWSISDTLILAFKIAPDVSNIYSNIAPIWLQYGSNMGAKIMPQYGLQYGYSYIGANVDSSTMALIWDLI